MRIVAGTFRGRPLVAPKGQSTRPTADRARQAIFNVLEHAAWSPGLAGRRVIDLFAGSGALGFEALSRGAEFCLFIDQDAAARAAIRHNAEALGAPDVRIDGRDVATLAARPAAEAPFDLALVDPPYGQGLDERALARLAAGDWLAAGALVVLERGSHDPPLAAAGFRMLDERRWGAARVAFLRASPVAR